MKKRFLSCIMLTASFICSLCFSACKEEAQKVSPILLNGYEEYNDMLMMDMVDYVRGRAQICNDEQYVTQGSGSLKLDIDFNIENTLYKFEHFTMWSIPIENLGDITVNLKEISEFSIDIYNANDEEFTFYLSATGKVNDVYFCEGYALNPNSWNHIKVQPKAWFFEADTNPMQLRFYVAGVNETSDKKATFYIDNFQMAVNSDVRMPEISLNGGSTTKKEILDFNEPSHLDALLMTTKLYYGTMSAWYQEAFIPFCAIKQVPTIKVGDRNGVMLVTFRRNDIWSEGWYKPEGYYFDVHSSLLTNISNTKTISIMCHNPDNKTHTASLIVKSGEQVFTQKENIAAGETKEIVLDVSGCSSIDALRLNVEAWSQAGEGHLYFADLRYMV